MTNPESNQHFRGTRTGMQGIATVLKRVYWRAREAPHRWQRRVRHITARILAFVAQIQVVGLTGWLAMRRPVQTAATSAAAKPHLLVISYYSPPYRSMFGTQRIAKFIKYLGRSGWQVTLLTTAPLSDEECDPPGEFESDMLRVVRLPSAGLRTTGARQGGFVPDDHLRWIRAATRAARALAAEQPFSAVLATAPPYSNFLAAAAVSSSCGLPMVADFRDPWSRIDAGWVIDRPILRQLNRWMEGVVLAHAARILVVCEKEFMHGYLVNESPDVLSRTLTITNGYDEEDFSDLPVANLRRERFTISYVGGLYDQETFDNVVEPLRIWQRSHPEDLADVELVYAGANSSYFEREPGLPCALRMLGYLPHAEAIRVRLDSDLQLFSLSSHYQPYVYSGKIFEMLRSGVPILAVARQDSAVSALVARTRAGHACSTHDEAASVLKDHFDAWKRGQPLLGAELALTRAYSREALAARLDEALRKLIDGGSAAIL
jgi:glycosyltransferase involved in cell wall biosynthesis